MYVIIDPMMTMGTGDIIYHPTNHVHYQLTHVDGTYVRMRACTYQIGVYGDEIQVERASLKGLILIPLASG